MALPCDLACVRHIQGRATCLTQLDQIASDEHIDCIIKLAGEPLDESSWSLQRKQCFLQSRRPTTDAAAERFPQWATTVIGRTRS